MFRLAWDSRLCSGRTGHNDDDVIHDIHIFRPGEEKDLGLQKPGVPLNYTFDKVGA